MVLKSKITIQKLQFTSYHKHQNPRLKEISFRRGFFLRGQAQIFPCPRKNKSGTLLSNSVHYRHKSRHSLYIIRCTYTKIAPFVLQKVKKVTFFYFYIIFSFFLFVISIFFFTFAIANKKIKILNSIKD